MASVQAREATSGLMLPTISARKLTSLGQQALSGSSAPGWAKVNGIPNSTSRNHASKAKKPGWVG
jgi:hypothetical protein